jgi:hypothetical protein
MVRVLVQKPGQCYPESCQNFQQRLRRMLKVILLYHKFQRAYMSKDIDSEAAEASEAGIENDGFFDTTR